MNRNADFFEAALAPEGNAPVASPNPYWQGHRIIDRDDLFPMGFSQVELDATYASLANDSHDLGLLLESPSLDELDYYNPGQDEVEENYVLEAITIEHFSRTERRMAAVVRVLNRYLSDSEITALSPVVGKPKKSGSFAYVIVQLPFSDGQTVNVVFHSPEGDKKRIGPSDAIIAFRWLLNKRDITHVVAPEDGEEVSLETIAKRITQLVVKNSARFERQQKAAQAERKELDDVREAVKNAEERQSDLMDKISFRAKEAESIEARLSNTLSLLEKQKTINAELQAKIDALRKSKPGGGTGDKVRPDKVDARFQEMIRTAARWKGAVEKVDVALAAMPNSNKKRMELNRLTTKGNLDAYLMHKYGIDAVAARDVSNSLTALDIPADKSAEINEFMNEPWAKLMLDGKPVMDSETPSYFRDLQDIVTGKYDSDDTKIGDLLDKAAEQAEADGHFEEFEALFNQAADHLTEVLRKKQGAM